MIVRPSKEGIVIRDPRTKKKLPPEGARVPDTSFWRRRILSGEVILMEEENRADQL